MNFMIRPPFIQCPLCKEETFGILAIEKTYFMRRCKNCDYPRDFKKGIYFARFELPKIKKKIIYLDQFVISEITKALQREAMKQPPKNQDDYWLEVFTILSKLNSMQLIICPYSSFHIDESVVSSELFSNQKKVYEFLAHGIQFELPYAIQARQIFNGAKLWMTQRANKYDINELLSLDNAFNEDIHQWEDSLFISFNLDYDSKEYIKSVKTDNEDRYNYLKTVFLRWKREKGRKFKHWFKEESESEGIYLINDFIIFWNYLIQEYPGIFDLEELIHRQKCDLLKKGFYQYLPNSYKIINSLGGIFLAEGCSSEDALNKVYEFLRSQFYCLLPFNKISSALYASIANNAANGSLALVPNKGTSNDISIISVLMPYCDAIFIDRPMHELINQAFNGLKKIGCNIDIKTQVFSASNKRKFIDYLSQLETSATIEHLTLITEIRGNGYKQFYNPLVTK